MSDSDAEITGGRNLSVLLLIFLAVCLHIVNVYYGYRFILWLFERSSLNCSQSRHALISCWDSDRAVAGEEDSEDDSEGVVVTRTTSLSHPQAAIVMTTCLWMLMFGAVSQWPFWVFPVILVVTFLVLAKFYLKGGQLPEKQQWITLLGYLTCLSTFATTAASMLWLCHSRWQMNFYGGPPAGHFALSAAIVGSIASLVFATATSTVYYVQYGRKHDDAGTVATCRDVESTFTAMK